MTSAQKVQDLQALATDLRQSKGTEVVSQINAKLDALAVELRDASQRLEYSSTKLAQLLHDLLSWVLVTEQGIASATAFQAARVAANLAAESDPGRTSLAEAGYPLKAIDALNLLTDVQARRALLISLLNLTVDQHTDTTAQLADWTTLDPLLRLATAPTASELRTSEDAWSFAKITWTILQAVMETSAEKLAPEVTALILASFTEFTDLFLPANVGSIPHDELPLFTLDIACKVLDKLAETDTVPLASCSEGLYAPLLALIEFVEHATPERFEFEEDVNDDDDGDSENPVANTVTPEKVMGAAKAAGIRVILNLCSSLSITEPSTFAFWDKIRLWLEHDREDLQSCALLALGNAARDDGSAQELASGTTSILPSAMSLLSSTTPVLVQHGLVGLLRNLSVLAANRPRLFEAGVLQKLLDMGVWSKDRDMMGSIQGGAIAVFKHLCRDNAEVSAHFMNLPTAVDQLLDVIARSDEPPLKWEGTRVFGNAIRSLSRDAQVYAKEIEVLSDRRIVALLADKLRTGSKHAILINEGVIALALLASFGPTGTVAIIDAEIRRGGSADQEQPTSAKDLLVSLAEGREGSQAVAAEIVTNVKTLLAQLPRDTPQIVEVDE